MKELVAVRMAIALHAHELRNKRLNLFVYNLPGLLMLQKLATSSTLCHRQVLDIILLL